MITINSIIFDIRGEPEWDGFLKMRKQIKKPLTERAIQMALSRLDTLAPGNIELQKQILDQSIFYCWLGLYPMMKDRKEKPGSQQASYDISQLEEMITRMDI